MNFHERKDSDLFFFFQPESSKSNAEENETVNLSAGAPGESLLKDCCEIFRIATEHRMVSYKTLISSQLESFILKFGIRSIA